MRSEDFDKMYQKLDKIDDKLDSVVERITVTETQNHSMSGQIKLIFTLIVAAITSVFAALSSKLFH